MDVGTLVHNYYRLSTGQREQQQQHLNRLVLNHEPITARSCRALLGIKGRRTGDGIHFPRSVAAGRPRRVSGPLGGNDPEPPSSSRLGLHTPVRPHAEGQLTLAVTQTDASTIRSRREEGGGEVGTPGAGRKVLQEHDRPRRAPHLSAAKSLSFGKKKRRPPRRSARARTGAQRQKDVS